MGEKRKAYRMLVGKPDGKREISNQISNTTDCMALQIKLQQERYDICTNYSHWISQYNL
jgi:hypothetical protein